MLKQCMDIFELLDRADVTGQDAAALMERYGAAAAVQHIQGQRGETDFIRVCIPGENGRSAGGPAPTIGIIGRLGGLGARPAVTGFVSDGDGALCALAAGLKLAEMRAHGDRIQGDVVVCTHICPNAPVVPHEPVPLMGSPVEDGDMCRLETEVPVDAILSVDTTKGNRIFCRRGFAITPTVREGYILRVSESLLDIMTRVTGRLPQVLPITTQDLTPYGNGIYHLNSIMQPSCRVDVPVVGVAITAEAAVAGCAAGATQLMDVEAAARFLVETAKDFTAGVCQFCDGEEFGRLKQLYGDRSGLYRGEP